MPTIPKYNISSTEEAGLNRAKKRINKLLEKGILKLTESPATDPTDGKADTLAEASIRQMEEISSILRQSNLLFEESGDSVVIQNIDDARKALRFIVVARKLMRRLLRELTSLAKGISYVTLGLYSDLKSAWKEVSDQYNVAYIYFTTIDLSIAEDDGIFDDVDSEYGDDDPLVPSILTDDLSSQGTSAERRQRTRESFRKVADFETLVRELNDLYDQVESLMNVITRDFNAARQQKVFARETVAEEDVLSGGRVLKKPVYRVGNHIMSSLYELDGLPKYI